MNEILLGLEEGLTDEQVKSYFKLPVDQMKQHRLAIISIEQWLSNFQELWSEKGAGHAIDQLPLLDENMFSAPTIWTIHIFSNNYFIVFICP